MLSDAFGSIFPSLFLATLLIFAANYTLTLSSRAFIYVRFLLAPLSFLALWDASFSPYYHAQVPKNLTPMPIAFVFFAMMKTIDACIVSIWDDRPPRWVIHGKVAPLPINTSGRLAYAFDLTCAVRGTSWFHETYWDFTPSSIRSFQVKESPFTFAIQKLRTLLLTVLFLDVFDTLTKMRAWDTTLAHPITSLPLHLRFFYTLCICAMLLPSLSIFNTAMAALSVLLGSDPASWPPLFNAPFSSTSVAELWTRRWHLTYRHTFGRMAHLPWLLASRYLSPRGANFVRITVIFFTSTLFHLANIAWLQVDERHPHRIDWPMAFCFMAQPFGIMFEKALVLPLTQPMPAPLRDLVRRVWVWGFMLWTGSYFCDVWVRRGMCDRDGGGMNDSLIRRLNWGPWSPYVNWERAQV
ncbi:hypothetical protein BOTBODRAFT_67147 [Botryobasidium botryosum FD-172 SS1]|uniref:Wax synthase domain-containing protein n=1 Tax=Botryobasidium botryosum (strain FD-172 SS1) TaxID=930990 RepID=A0A067ME34_BOTB1|nr:hypothetical protein BOTBODRAFT_67147 [Botryobasidium botryosum FD-172 SS1]